MKFAHFADCHLGGWAENAQLRELGMKSFERGIEISLNEGVEFIILAGDLFNTAIPSIDVLKFTAKVLRKVKERNVSVYVVPGSHDFSASGKTMLDVLEGAGLLVNVVDKENFVNDKSGIKLIGMMGLKGGLEKEHYGLINRENIEREIGDKIYVFHTTIDDFKPEEMKNVEGVSISELPSGFNYYAGGHVHYILDKEHKRGRLVYPGPTFPNNFRELEKLEKGSFCIVNDFVPELKSLELKNIKKVFLDVEGKTPEEVGRLINEIEDFEDKILLIRIEGVLSSGKPSDINFRELFKRFDSAYTVLKNVSKLVSKEVEEITVEQTDINEIEKEAISKVDSSFFSEDKVDLLMNILDKEKEEGEKVADFEDRIMSDIRKSLGIGNI